MPKIHGCVLFILCFMVNVIFLILFNTKCHISLLHPSYLLLGNIAHSNELHRVMKAINMKQRREKIQTGICNRLDIFNL